MRRALVHWLRSEMARRWPSGYVVDSTVHRIYAGDGLGGKSASRTQVVCFAEELARSQRDRMCGLHVSFVV